MKIHSVVAEFSRADRRTDMTNLIVALYNFANAPKKRKFQRPSNKPQKQGPGWQNCMKSTPAQHYSRCQYLPVRMSDGTEQLALDRSADTSRALSDVLTRKGTRPLKMYIRCPTNVDSIVNYIKRKMNVSDSKTQFVPRSKHSAPVIKTNQLMFVLRSTQNT
jgi:hypothetical protein